MVRRRRLRARGQGCRGEREAATEIARLYPALEQAIGDVGENIPVVLHRSNNRPWVAIVRLDDLPRLAVQLYLTLAENH